MEGPRPTPIFRARVNEQGGLCPVEVGRWFGYLAKMKGKQVEVIVRPERKHRSMSQNRYLWGVVYAAASEWSGHDSEELHQVFKARFLPGRQIVLPTGELLDGPGSTADLSMEDFSAYVSKVIRFLAEQGVHVPSADEVA
jgi:hypothetical protein